MIEARALTRRFGAFTAVDSLSLSVAAGQILALLGPNGAGKTTTVRMLAALIAPSAGDATVAGYDVRRQPDEVRACVGLVTDAPGLYEQMPLVDYLDMFGTIYGLPSGPRRKRVNELIDFFELGPNRAQRLVGFSKGMKQKVALARALIHEPPVLYLDEPTAGLDPLSARAVRDLILSLKHSQRALVLCTHDLDEAERLADEVAIMTGGRIAARNTPAVLRGESSASRRVRVRLAGPCPAAPAALAGVAGLSDPEPTLDAAGVMTGLTYCVAEPERANPQAVVRLAAAGAEIVELIVDSPTLEDVYARVMAGAAHDQPQGGHRAA